MGVSGHPLRMHAPRGNVVDGHGPSLPMGSAKHFICGELVGNVVKSNRGWAATSTWHVAFNVWDGHGL